jgi:hypothetical protein
VLAVEVQAEEHELVEEQGVNDNETIPHGARTFDCTTQDTLMITHDYEIQIGSDRTGRQDRLLVKMNVH